MHILTLQSPNQAHSSRGQSTRKQSSGIVIAVLFLSGISCCHSFNLRSLTHSSKSDIGSERSSAISTLRCQSWLPSRTGSDTSLFMVTPLFHMGHSHSHSHTVSHPDDTHENEDDLAGLSPKQKAEALRRRRRRRVALCLFCALATLGPKLMKSSPRGGLLPFLRPTKLDKVSSSTFKSYEQQLLARSTAGVNGAPDTSEADRVTWIGVVINILLSVAKLTVGIAQHSSVLIADAGHSFSDLISDFITLWSVQIARLPPDEDHPYGHTKFEAIGSLFLSMTLLATGLSVGFFAHLQLIPFLNAAALSPGTSALAAAAVQIPGPLALVVAAISIASKEWLYRITKRVGEKLNSPVVVANAWHHRSDAYSSVLALGSIAFARAGYPAADAAAGLLVAGMIGLTGFDIMVQSIQQLSDSAHLGLQDEMRVLVQKWIDRDPDVQGITTVRARQVGSSAFCDVIVETSPELSTTANRAVEERLKRYLVPAMSDRTGQWITATVHAKAPLVVCPLLEATRNVAEYETGRSSFTSNIDSPDEHPDEKEAVNMSFAATPGLREKPLLPAELPAIPIKDEELSSSKVEGMVRQQALLLNAVSSREMVNTTAAAVAARYDIQGVTVHYQSPERVSVDVTIHLTQAECDDLQAIQGAARKLQTALQDEVTEIQSARIYLDLLA